MTFEIKDKQVFIQHNTEDRGNRPVFSVKFRIFGKTFEVAVWPAKSGKEGSYSGSIKFIENDVDHEADDNKRRPYPDSVDVNPTETDEIPF